MRPVYIIIFKKPKKINNHRFNKMLKRQHIKKPLIALIVLSSLTIITQIVSIVLQGIKGFTGFDNVVISQACPTYTLSYKLSYAYKIYQVSFIGLIVSCCCLIAVQVLLVIGLVQYLRDSRQSVYKQPINTNNNNNNYEINANQHNQPPTQPPSTPTPSPYQQSPQYLSSYSPYFTYNKIIIGYILYSITILGLIIHFGLILSLCISSVLCIGSMYLILLIVCGLSILGFVMIGTCWILWQVWRCKMHKEMDQHCQYDDDDDDDDDDDGEEEDQEGYVQGHAQAQRQGQGQNAVDQNGNAIQSNNNPNKTKNKRKNKNKNKNKGVNNQIQMQNMNTMYPLKTDQDGNPIHNHNNNNNNDPYDDNYYQNNGNNTGGGNTNNNNNQQANYVSFQNKHNNINRKNTNTYPNKYNNNNNNINQQGDINNDGQYNDNDFILAAGAPNNNMGKNNNNNGNMGKNNMNNNRNSPTKVYRKQSNTNPNTNNPNDINTNGNININININRGSGKQTQIFTLNGDSNKIQKKPTPKFITDQNQQEYLVKQPKNSNMNMNTNMKNSRGSPTKQYSQRDPLAVNQLPVYSNNKNKNTGSPIKKPYIADSKEQFNQMRGSPYNKEHYLSYLMEQNQGIQPHGNRDDALKESGGKPFFKSPKKKQQKIYPHKSPLEKYQDILNKKGSLELSRNLAPAFNNNQSIRQSQKSKIEEQAQTDKKLNQSISEQKLHEQQRKFFQTNNHNSLLRRDSLHQSSNDQTKIVNLHKNMEKQREINNQPKKQQRYYDNPKAIKKNKKKGLLIDYIRSKYVD